MELAIDFFAEHKGIVTVLHVLTVVLGMGAALMSDILFSFYSHDKKLSRTEAATLQILSTVVWTSLIAIIVSGVGLFFSDMARYMVSTKFLAKMTIMGVLITNGFILHRYISRVMTARGFLSSAMYTHERKVAFACGAISVTSWVTLCTLGVLNSVSWSYQHVLALYGVVVLVAITVALFVERATFETARRRA